MSTPAILRHRRDTAANWTANNPVLEDGQLGFETDTRNFKIGDGVTAWASLAYAVSDGKNFTIENRTSDPGTPAVGQIWLRTDL